MKSILSQAGSSLLVSRNDLPVSPEKKEQSVRYLISNGKADGSAADNSAQSRFKAKQPLSYNDFYYSQTPQTQTEYARILDAQIAQKREFSQIQEETQSNNKSLSKVNNINPHLIPAEPNLAPNHGFQLGAQTKYTPALAGGGFGSGYDQGFQPKRELQRTGLMNPLSNSIMMKGSQQNISHMLPYQSSNNSGLINQMYSQTNLRTPGQGAQPLLPGLRSRAISQEDLNLSGGGLGGLVSRYGQSGYVPQAGQFQATTMTTPSNQNTRGILRRENMSEEQILEKERQQREINYALQEQVLQKKKQKELEERKNQLEDLFFEQKLKIAQHQESQNPRQQALSSHRVGAAAAASTAAPPSPRIQFPANNKSNQQIESLHTKSDKNKIAAAAAAAATSTTNRSGVNPSTNPNGASTVNDEIPDFTQIRQLQRTPPAAELQQQQRYTSQPSEQFIPLTEPNTQRQRAPSIPTISPRPIHSQRQGMMPSINEIDMSASRGIQSSRQDIPAIGHMNHNNNNQTSATHGRATALSQQPQNRVRAGLNVVEEETKQLIEKDIDYFQDYYEFQTKVFNRQMNSLQRDVNNVNATRTQVFKDMLHLREKSKQEHLMNLMKPSDVLEDNRLWLAQRKQNLYISHRMADYVNNPYLNDIPYLQSPGLALERSLLEQQQPSPQLIFQSEIVPDSSYLAQQPKKKKKVPSTRTHSSQLQQQSQNQELQYSKQQLKQQKQQSNPNEIEDEEQLKLRRAHKRRKSVGGIPKSTISEILPFVSKRSSIQVSSAQISHRDGVLPSPTKQTPIVLPGEEKIIAPQLKQGQYDDSRPVSALSFFVKNSIQSLKSKQFRKECLPADQILKFELERQNNQQNGNLISVNDPVWEVYSDVSDDYDQIDEEIDGYFHEISELVTSEAKPVNLNSKPKLQQQKQNNGIGSKTNIENNSQSVLDQSRQSQQLDKSKVSQNMSSSNIPLDQSNHSSLSKIHTGSSQQPDAKFFNSGSQQSFDEQKQKGITNSKEVQNSSKISGNNINNKSNAFSNIHAKSMNGNDTLFEKSLNNLESMIAKFKI